MTRAVVDTNLVVSAFLWGGNPRAILDAARRETLTLFTSAALIAELEDVLSRAKFASRIAAGRQLRRRDARRLSRTRAARSADRAPGRRARSRRRPRHRLRARAQAEVIVSSDDDLLTLGRYRDIDVLSVAQMLRRLSAT